MLEFPLVKDSLALEKCKCLVLEQSGSEQSVFLFLRNPEDVVWGSRGMIVINGDAGIRRLDIDG